MNKWYVTQPIIIWSEFCDPYAHVSCKFKTIILKTVGVPETQTTIKCDGRTYILCITQGKTVSSSTLRQGHKKGHFFRHQIFFFKPSQNHTYMHTHQNHLITKTSLYYFDPLKPHFYIVKLGFTGVYIICLIFAWKNRLWVLVRTTSPRQF